MSYNLVFEISSDGRLVNLLMAFIPVLILDGEIFANEPEFYKTFVIISWMRFSSRLFNVSLCLSFHLNIILRNQKKTRKKIAKERKVIPDPIDDRK